MKHFEKIAVYSVIVLLFGYLIVVPDKNVGAVESETSDNPGVTGVGGVFFKAKDPKKIKEWYHKHLGLKTDEHGAKFEFRSIDDPDVKGILQWSPFSADTKYFEPSDKDFMINFRVRDIEKLVKKLKAAGVPVVDSIAIYSYGKFVHILDPENNKIELWEPVQKKHKKRTENGY